MRASLTVRLPWPDISMSPSLSGPGHWISVVNNYFTGDRCSISLFHLVIVILRNFVFSSRLYQVHVITQTLSLNPNTR